MRQNLLILPLLASLGLAGCSDGSIPPIDNPAELPALTESDKEKIRAQDAQIEAEERGQPVLPAKKNKRSRAQNAQIEAEERGTTGNANSARR